MSQTRVHNSSVPSVDGYTSQKNATAQDQYVSLQIKVVNRDLVAVLTQATLTDAEMLQAQPDAVYILSITEQELDSISSAVGEPQAAETVSSAGKHVRIGICAVDVASARFILGQW